MSGVLVTGGAGFIGAALVKRLVEKGAQVRVLDSEFRGNRRRLDKYGNRIEFWDADIRNVSDVYAAMRDVDEVWHLAAINGTANFYDKPDQVLDVGIKGILNVIDAARHQGLRSERRLFVMSSSEVYGQPFQIPTPEEVPLTIKDVTNPRYSYAGSKIITEQLALFSTHNAFSNVVVVRPHNIYGPDMGYSHVIPELICRARLLIEQQKDNPPPWYGLSVHGTGTESRSFCYIDDCIDALMLLRTKGQHKNIYNVGRRDSYSIKRLVSVLSFALEKQLKCLPTGNLAQGSPKARCPDISKLEALGYVSRVSLPEGVKKTVEWYLNNPEPT